MTEFADVRSYYEQRWGEPDREACFEKGPIGIGVLKWLARPETEGVTLYATAGVSGQRLNGAPDTHRQEFYVGLSPECDDIASPLAWLGLYATSSVPRLAGGHIFRTSDEVMNGTGFNGFFFLESTGSGLLPPIVLSDGHHVEFLMSVPALVRN